MKFSILCLSLVALAGFAPGARSQAFYSIYQDTYARCSGVGSDLCPKFFVAPSSCENFEFVNHKSYINTFGNCIKIWEERNCKGNHALFKTELHLDVSVAHQDHQMSSISDCKYGESVRNRTSKRKKLNFH